MRNLELGGARWMRVRIALLALLLLCGAGAGLHRAYRIQILEGDTHQREADAQQLRDVHLAPKRGTIYDRHGAELAVSVDVESVYANPRQMRREHVDTAVAARRLAGVLGIEEATLVRRLAQDRYFVWIERQVTPEEAAAVRSLGIDGVELTREAQRFYPNRELAAHILGFANVDGEGLEGVEASLEEHLHGSTEAVPAVRDRRGRVVFSDTLLDDRGTQGDDVYLTIDKTIQHVAERELSLAVRTFEARAGNIVVMDPTNGEILAMASYPTYDPNAPGESPPDHRRFRAITDRFEPGSTVKPFTIAAALAAGAVRADEQFDCFGDRPPGQRAWDLGDGLRAIRDDHPLGMATPAQILAFSSNIGTGHIGIELGRAGLYRGFRRFGFGQTTGVPLPGESAGVLRHHSRWSERDTASIAFGQGMSATTLQMAAAMSALANGGRLMEPVLVRRIVDARGETVEEAAPEVRRQVVPRATARLVADMLTAVTGEDGTGAEAAIPGYLVAGKTGTAQKASETHAGYDDDRWLASFVGFVPAEAPRLVIAVMIDEPVISHYGGVVAGPVFRRVGELSLRHLGVPPAGGGDALAELEREVRTRREAAATAEAASAAREDAEPASDEPAVAEIEPGEGETRVPDVRGATARRAMVALAEAGLEPELEGTGVVVAQSPLAGTIAPRGALVRAVLERPTWDEAAIVDAPEDTIDAQAGSAARDTALASAAGAPR